MASAAAEIETLELEPVEVPLGSWVSGFKLGDPDNPAKSGALLRALSERGVLFFDFGRAPSEDEFLDFAALFGEVQHVYGQKVKDRAEKDKVPYIDNGIVPMEKHHQNWWHSDSGPFERPPMASLLTPIEVPEIGGGTMWSSMYAAYEALSPHMQQMLDGMRIVNNNCRATFLEPREFVHPAVVVNPITGRRSLFVDPIYTERFEGVPDKESDALLRFLFDHINTPEFHAKLSWKIGYAAVWHQTAVKHRGIDGFKGPRKLRRLTVNGDRPRGPKD